MPSAPVAIEGRTASAERAAALPHWAAPPVTGPTRRCRFCGSTRVPRFRTRRIHSRPAGPSSQDPLAFRGSKFGDSTRVLQVHLLQPWSRSAVPSSAAPLAFHGFRFCGSTLDARHWSAQVCGGAGSGVGRSGRRSRRLSIVRRGRVRARVVRGALHDGGTSTAGCRLSRRLVRPRSRAGRGALRTTSRGRCSRGLGTAGRGSRSPGVGLW